MRTGRWQRPLAQAGHPQPGAEAARRLAPCRGWPERTPPSMRWGRPVRTARRWPAAPQPVPRLRPPQPATCAAPDDGQRRGDGWPSNAAAPPCAYVRARARQRGPRRPSAQSGDPEPPAHGADVARVLHTRSHLLFFFHRVSRGAARALRHDGSLLSPPDAEPGFRRGPRPVQSCSREAAVPRGRRRCA